MKNFLVNAGRIGQGIDRAAVSSANAKIARLQASEQERLAREMAQRREEFFDSYDYLEDVRRMYDIQPGQAGLRINDQPGRSDLVPQQSAPQVQAQTQPTAGIQTQPAPQTQAQPQAAPQVAQPARAREAQAGATAQAQPEAAPQVQEPTPQAGLVTEVPVSTNRRNNIAFGAATQQSRDRRAARVERAADGTTAERAGARLGNYYDWFYGVAREGGNALIRAGAHDVAGALDIARGAGLPVPRSWSDSIRGVPNESPTTPDVPPQPAPIAEPQQAGVTTPEDSAPLEEKAPALVDNPDPQVTKKAVEADRTPSGAKTTRIWEKSDFYLANPQSITPDMHHAMAQRQVMASLARAQITMNNFEAAAQSLMAVASMDHGMFMLQGMQGIHELQDFGDPRRLSAALSKFSGAEVNVIPNLDGTWDIERSGRVTASGVQTDTIAQQATQMFSLEAQRSAAEMANLYQTEMIKHMFASDMQTQKAHAMIMNTLRQGANAMELELLKSQLKEMGIDLVSAHEGTIIINYRGRIMQFHEAEAGQSASWVNRMFGVGTAATPDISAGLRGLTIN